MESLVVGINKQVTEQLNKLVNVLNVSLLLDILQLFMLLSLRGTTARNFHRVTNCASGLDWNFLC